MKSFTFFRRAVIVGFITCAVAMPHGAAWAADGVTVQASGPKQVVTSTESSTGRITATFVVADPTMTATGATICRTYDGGGRYGCRYQRFDGQPVEDADGYLDDPSDYADDEYARWDVSGRPGEWTVAYPIGFDGISREQCLGATWRDAPFAAVMDVKNDAGTILGSGNWTYRVLCTGIEGGSSGPERTRLSTSHSVTSKSFTFLALDTTKVLTSFRVCRYSSVTERYFACDREVLTRRNRQDENWAVSYSITWPAQGAAGCAYVGRKWPQEGLRVQFYDRDLDQRLSLFRGTRLDC